MIQHIIIMCDVGNLDIAVLTTAVLTTAIHSNRGRATLHFTVFQNYSAPLLPLRPGAGVYRDSKNQDRDKYRPL